MNTLLLLAVWVHLAACVLLTGSFSLLLMAGNPQAPAMRQWEEQILTVSRWMVVAALASGVVWLALRTAMFEGRSEAAIEAPAILRAMLDTWPGNIWMLRQGLLLVLAAFLWLDRNPSNGWDRFAARLEGFLLSALALILVGASGHSAAISDERWPSLVDMVHLLGAGIWIGGLPPLVLLLRAASYSPASLDACAVSTMRRFSHVALVTVLALAASGIVTSSLLVEGLPGLVGTTHGRLLLGKIAVLLPALLLAAASRALLPELSGPSSARPGFVARRMALFIALEAALVLLLLGLAAAMTINTPARHADPVWPLPFRVVGAVPRLWSVQGILSLAGIGAMLLAAAFLAWRHRWAIAGLVAVALAGSVGLSVSPSIVKAFPTSFTRSPVAYNAGSIAHGARLHAAHCATCHAAGKADGQQRTASPARSAGELFWLTTHRKPQAGMPPFGDELDDTQRWHLVNYLRANETAGDPRQIGTAIELDNGWLVAPDFTFSVGSLAPRTLREFRGRRMVLLVLYTLPESRERMTELARRYGALSVLGVEVIAVAPRSSAGAIAELGANPPTFFPVITSGNEDIDSTYRMFAPGGSAHTEFLIDRQGYIRAMWRSDRTGMPSAAAVQAEVERLNEEKAPPPLPDDHIH